MYFYILILIIFVFFIFIFFFEQSIKRVKLNQITNTNILLKYIKYLKRNDIELFFNNFIKINELLKNRIVVISK
jgi:hypothetical protein